MTSTNKKEETFALGAGAILKHALGKEDALEAIKGKKVIVYQQDLLDGIGAIDFKEWTPEMMMRIWNILYNTVLMPSEVKKAKPSKIFKLREECGIDDNRQQRSESLPVDGGSVSESKD